MPHFTCDQATWSANLRSLLLFLNLANCILQCIGRCYLFRDNMNDITYASCSILSNDICRLVLILKMCLHLPHQSFIWGRSFHKWKLFDYLMVFCDVSQALCVSVLSLSTRWTSTLWKFACMNTRQKYKGRRHFLILNRHDLFNIYC